MSRQATLHVHRFAPLAMALALVGCATAAGRPPPVPGRIEGVIQHPAQGTYRIDGLPPGDYQMFAETEKGIYRTGGHMQAVQCIRAPCPEQPKTVAVTAGTTLRDIDLTHFYDERADFPALPPMD